MISLEDRGQQSKLFTVSFTLQCAGFRIVGTFNNGTNLIRECFIRYDLENPIQKRLDFISFSLFLFTYYSVYRPYFIIHFGNNFISNQIHCTKF